MYSFVEIPNYIVENIIKHNDCINLNHNIPKNYNLILTGSVGVGKSTLSQLVYEYFKINNITNIQIYPEYIQYKYNNNNIGDDILNLRKNGVIDTETFQHFILDIWEFQLRTKEFNKKNSINILERLPDDAIFCFSKEAFQQGIISTESYFNLCVKYKKIIEKYDVPTFSDCQIKVINNDNLNNTLTEILNVIKNDFENGIINRIIGLKTEEKKYIQRIKQRGRISELETDIEIFKRYNKFYDEIYNDSFLNQK